jgi:hypothetical protein
MLEERDDDPRTRGPSRVLDHPHSVLYDEVASRATPQAKSEEMSHKNVRSVEPDGKRGGWKVTAPGSSRASGRLPTQATAEKRAKQIVKRAGGGLHATFAAFDAHLQAGGEDER